MDGSGSKGAYCQDGQHKFNPQEPMTEEEN